MTEYTVERRSFLLGAILAPFAGRFALAGVEPHRNFTEFTVRISGDDGQFDIRLDENVIPEVVYSKGSRRVPMIQHYAVGSWLHFTGHHDKITAGIQFRVDDEETITIDYAMAIEMLVPAKSPQDSYDVDFSAFQGCDP